MRALPAGGTTINFSGTAGQVREAFHTEIHILADGQHWANMSIPQMPAALAPAVIGIPKLNNFMPHTNIVHRTSYLPSGAAGVLSTSDSKYKPAFATGKGYDLVTGIGTVNVANLVNAWP